MVMLLGVGIPPSNFALAATFERFPELRVEIEPAVGPRGGDRWAMWTATPSSEPIVAALRNDPTAREPALVTETEKRALYELELVGRTATLLEIVLTGGGTVLAVTGTNGGWCFTLRFSNRIALTRTYRRIEEADFSPTIYRLHGGAKTTDCCDLTPPQREALRRAARKGYFEIPREVSQSELADELGICHQALSERLRRGIETVVVNELESKAILHRIDAGNDER